MKLLKKNNRTFFRFALLLLAIGGILLFIVINYILHDESDEALHISELHVRQILERGEDMPGYAHFLQVDLDPEAIPAAPVLSDVLVFDPIENEEEPYRELRSVRRINGKTYRIRILSSLVGREDLLSAIGISIIILMLLLLSGLTLINRFFSRTLWLPFRTTLSELRGFSLTREEDLKFGKTDIDEFDELNEVLELLTMKVRADYRNLKEFTENASHEIQTPLAIIRSKVEVLIEKENISEQEMQNLGVIYQAVNRLSKLNQSLLLLAKIENLQFHEKQEISFAVLVQEQLTPLEELTEAKDLRIETDFPVHPFSLLSNRTLADILVKNLLENTVRHSEAGDTIHISLTDKQLVFANPGAAAAAQPDRLFERFRHGGKSTNSTGLGLAIVQQICQVNGWKVSYSFESGKHQFSVTF